MAYKKKYPAIFLAAVLAASLAGCGASGGDTQEQEETAAQTQESADSSDSSESTSESQSTGGSNILIAYFTAAENSGVDAEASASYSEVDGEAKGRMEALAEMIQAETGGDLFSIQTEEVYPADGGDLIDYAAQEQDEDARPTLSTHIENLDNYDTIFIGYPIWWGEAAWPVDSFVENNDFTGKTVIPFATSASSGMGESGQLLADMAGTGDWQEGQRFSSSADEADVQEWIDGLGL